jgi:adhesin transport system membrane fusion protein
VTADAWRDALQTAHSSQASLCGRVILYCVAGLVLAFAIWASWATVDEVTRGSGRVIPSQHVQIIQSQDGGVVRELLVREGDEVSAGQLLVRLDQTRSTSSFRENLSEYQSLMARAGRLRATVDGVPFVPDPELVASIPDVVAQEQALYLSRRDQLLAETAIAQQQLEQRREELREISARNQQLSRSLALVQQELAVTRPMVNSGAVSQVEILRLEREVNQLSGEFEQSGAARERVRAAIREAERRLEEVELEFMNRHREQLAETLGRANGLREAASGLSDRVTQAEIRSPLRGTVKQLFFNTLGGVVMPGREIIEIVPLDDTLLVEVRIRPQDIAFLAPGQSARVKFSAYDFVVYGGLDAEVEQIGADTVRDEEGNPFYNVRVRTLQAGLGEGLPVIPGMTVEVDILTGKKSVLSYLMKPILRARQYALTER